jgi:hypothetical protein
MTIEVAFNEQEQIIEVMVEESFNWSVVERVAPQVSRLALEKHTFHVLLDFRRSGITLSTVQIYMTPEKAAEEFKKYGVDILQLRRAVLIQHNDRDFHFLETVTINKLQPFRVFFDEAAARAWLKE